MTTDNRTNEPTEAMILAGLNAYSSKGLEIDGYETTEEYPSLEMWGDRFASQMRAALVAAQGAAPQAESEELVAPSLAVYDKGRKYGFAFTSLQSAEFAEAAIQEYLKKPDTAPVLPSSTVDEDALALIVEAEMLSDAAVSDEWSDFKVEKTAERIARAVAAWLKE